MKLQHKHMVKPLEQVNRDKWMDKHMTWIILAMFFGLIGIILIPAMLG